MAADKTNRLYFLTERNGCIDTVENEASACRRHVRDLACNLPSKVVDIPMPMVGKSTADFFSSDRRPMLHLTYS